ncbi:hypothetical protein EBU24_05855 [bacterium]|nr:hypothetical protein [bacterium]
MQPAAFIRYKYSADFYKFVREVVGDTTTVKYYFVGNIAISAGIDTAGRLSVRSDQPLPIGCLIANIKDADGNLILDDQVWQVSSLQPVLNSFNTIESYQMKTTKYQGTL